VTCLGDEKLGERLQGCAVSTGGEGGGGAGERCKSHAQPMRLDKPRVIHRLRPCLNYILTWGVI